MMTRTCALELHASSAILMNSVDTGWINDENPLEKAAATAERHHFQARGRGRGSPIPKNSPISNPYPHPALTLNPKRNHFQTPLDEVDAAARILDPILSVVNGGEHVHGKFLKDYRAIEW